MAFHFIQGRKINPILCPICHVFVFWKILRYFLAGLIGEVVDAEMVVLIIVGSSIRKMRAVDKIFSVFAPGLKVVL